MPKRTLREFFTAMGLGALISAGSILVAQCAFDPLRTSSRRDSDNIMHRARAEELQRNARAFYLEDTQYVVPGNIDLERLRNKLVYDDHTATSQTRAAFCLGMAEVHRTMALQANYQMQSSLDPVQHERYLRSRLNVTKGPLRELEEWYETPFQTTTNP